MDVDKIDYAALEAERAELEKDIAEAPHWGASVAARQERLKGIIKTLANAPKGE